jgi:acyl dehydratase
VTEPVYFEEVALGEVLEGGYKFVDRREIMRFAKAYDPQPFHLDEAAARQSIFGGLIASGWHTLAMMMRMMVDTSRGRLGALGSPGCEDIRWLQPVRPNDVLSFRSECIEKTPSRSKPDRGIVKFQVAVFNQRGEAVMGVTTIAMYPRRPGS